jgi:uroporphyrinogen decarboxylase
MWSDPEAWNLLMSKIAEVVRRYLRAQVEAGAQAVQLFDSWVGALSPHDYAELRDAPRAPHPLGRRDDWACR